MSRESIIEISGLTKKYGNFTAVDHLDLSIGKGEVFGLLGPNGAGKSTTILIMMGLTEPDEGSVSICGINPLRNPVEVKRKVGYLPEDVGFYDRYTGGESLTFTAMLNTKIAIAKPHVNFSSKSVVFLTPIILLAPEPPN